MALVTPHKLVQQVCLVPVDLVLGLAVLALPHSLAQQEPALMVFRPHKLALSAYWALPCPEFWLAVLALLHKSELLEPALMVFRSHRLVEREMLVPPVVLVFPWSP